MLARRIERDAAEDDQLVARLVERPRQDLRRILGVPRGHLAPRLHHARRRVAQPVAVRLLADEAQQRRHRLLGVGGRELQYSCCVLWQDVSLRTMFYKLIIAKAILLTLLAANVTAQTPDSAARLARGTAQVRQFWRASDGDAKQLDEFIRTNFAADQQTLDALFARMEFAFESIDGHMTVIGRDLRQQSDLDLGPIYPFDEILAGYAPGAHLDDDLFANKLAFVVLLNFPLTTLEERLTRGDTWSRRQWAEARLAQRFSKRIPAEVHLANAKASAEAAQYVDNYNIWMHNLVEDDGTRL